MENNLIEAAAELLGKSKKGSVPAMPMPDFKQSYDEYTKRKDINTNEVDDLGGDTPYQREKGALNYTKGSYANSPTPAEKPGADPKVGAMPMPDFEQEYSEYDNSDDDEIETDDVQHIGGDNNYTSGMKRLSTVTNTAPTKGMPMPKLKEDIDAIFEGETLSEEFKERTKTIFEARVHDRVSQIQEDLEQQYNKALEDSMEELTLSLTEKVNDYLNYVVEEWMSENSIAIEKGLRTELTEDFMVGLRNLFTENYIDIPDDKVDLVEELSDKVSELEEQLNEQINFGIQLKKNLDEAKKNEVIYSITEGLTDTQVEKIKTLAESVVFTTEDEYAEKLETIRENYFPSGVVRTRESYLHESIEDEVASPKVTDPRMAAYFNTISRTLPR